MSQLVDSIRMKITGDARYYLQELNRSFKFSFEPQADRLEPRVPLQTLYFLHKAIQYLEVLQYLEVRQYITAWTSCDVNTI